MRFRFGEFELDEPRFELRCREQLVEIQPKVLDLITYLVRHRDRVVAKNELLDNIWPGVVVSEASLSQAVSAARRVLGDDGAVQTHIKTVRGRGFRFVAPVESLADSIRPRLPVTMPESEPLSSTFESAAAVAVPTPSGARSLEAETFDDEGRGQPRSSELAPHLFVALHCDQPRAGGARYNLVGVDEVEVIRGAERSVQRGDGTRRLAVSLPGNKVSRVHARLVRSRDRWELVDNDSRNGTFLNGARVSRATVQDGDVIECGRNMLLFRSELSTLPEVYPDIDTRGLKDDGLGSLLPRQQIQRHALRRIARSGLTLLILGEAGSGKELAARAFHRLSGRPGPLVPVSCGAVPSDRIEQTLFGTAGSSEADPKGLFREAEGGTLFLDQVESLSAAAQASLLRTLEELVIVPVGSQERVPVDVRVIAATALPITQLVESGQFRRDLYTRIAGFVYEAPPLRERTGDLGLLLATLLEEIAPDRTLTLSPEVGLALLRYGWPGNVRELRQALISALALAGTDDNLELRHLPEVVSQSVPSSSS